MDTENKKCTVCAGSGVNKAKTEDLNNSKEIQYQPIECQHCHGSGKEPE